MILASITCVLLGGILFALGAASRAERLPRNYIAGIKTGRMLASDEAWRIGHRAAAPVFLGVGAVGLVFGVILAIIVVVASPPENVVVTLMLVYLGLTLVGLAFAVRIAHRAVR
jgi:hypothetical protein